jgi:non-specific protein-tyrosine kinase
MSKLKKALEKAREARGDYPSNSEPQAAMTIRVPAIPQDASAEQLQSPFKPVYDQSLKCTIDPLLMDRNRVISVCTNDVADGLKILRSQIINALSQGDKNTLLVTSANYQEGKTLTALNLAISFSHQTNRTVLLVDADIRKPSIQEYLGLGERPGLSDYLSGRAEMADLFINPGMERIVIIPGGKPMRNSAELLASPRMHLLFDDIKRKYPERFIIFDGAPVLKSADALVFANFIDGILLVVEAEKTTRDDLKRVLDMLKDKPIIGTALNKVRD